MTRTRRTQSEDAMTEKAGSIIVYHGSQQVVSFPQLKPARFFKDFGSGFYCIRLERQAKRWATRFGDVGFVNEYAFTPDPSLAVKTFEGMSEQWLDFIAGCRAGKSHSFDIVEGPMANDTIFNYVQNFIDGKISRDASFGYCQNSVSECDAFLALARFKYPTNQISFNTQAALSCLVFKRACEVRT